MSSNCMLIIVFIIYGHFVSSNTFAKPILIQEFCSGGKYTTNNSYQNNLIFLLNSSLTLFNNEGVTNGYRSASIGSDQDAVHGAFQCRGDLKPEECQICFDVATADVEQNRRCPNAKKAILWYDTCNLRYSNEVFFSDLLQKPVFYIVNQTSITTENQDEFNKSLVGLTDRLIRESVVSGESTKSFAVGEANLSASGQIIYGLVQCSDIASSDCKKCLGQVARNLSECCSGKVGATVLNPSCNFRYEMYPFYEPKVIIGNSTPPRSSSLPPPPTSPSTRAKGNDLPVKIVIIGIVLSVIAAVLCAISIWCCLCSRKASREPGQLPPQSVTRETETKQVDRECLVTRERIFKNSGQRERRI